MHILYVCEHVFREQRGQINFQKEKILLELTSSDKSKFKVEALFFNMKKDLQLGFGLLQQYTQADKKSIVVVCGGDGTIMWVISEMQKFSISFEKVPITIVPLGTGNDFSQHFGWGNARDSLVQNSYKTLKKLAQRWIVADEEPFDLWQATAEIFEYGKIQKVNNQFENQILETKTITKNFCNYFSFGIDGKVGYSFDMHRRSSRMGNILVYGALGLIKSATTTKTVKELVEKMEKKQELKEQAIEKQIKEQVQHQQNPCQMSHIIFDNTQSQQKSSFFDKNDSQSILALNISSFMGGVRGIWQQAKVGICKSEQISNLSSSQDGKLDIIAFSSGMSLAFERMFGGFATKVQQGSGPYSFTFKEHASEKKHRTYLQIDGEFLRVTHPKRIEIRKSQINGGKIRVLKRNIKKQGK